MQYYAYLIHSLEARAFLASYSKIDIYLTIGTTKLLEIWQAYFYTPLVHVHVKYKMTMMNVLKAFAILYTNTWKTRVCCRSIMPIIIYYLCCDD